MFLALSEAPVGYISKKGQRNERIKYCCGEQVGKDITWFTKHAASGGVLYDNGTVAVSYDEKPQFYATFHLANDVTHKIYTDKLRLSVLQLNHVKYATEKDAEILRLQALLAERARGQ